MEEVSVGSFAEFDVVETLDSVEAAFDARLVADAEMFELATHFADLHCGDSLRHKEGRDGRVLPGMERAVQLGGAGTPLVAEFACLELGARMQLGSWSAKRYLADALDCRHRLPACWAQVRDRRARIGWVRLVAAKTRHLSIEAAAYVDAAMAEHVDGSLPWGRFEARLDGKVVAADPETAAAREAARAAEQFAKRTRSSEDGTAGFYVRSTIGVIARIEATIAFVAEALKVFGDTEPAEVRRVKALVVLCNPTKAVELLAAFAAHRARTIDDPLPDPEDPGTGGRACRDQSQTAGDDAGAESGLDRLNQQGPLDRMDAFARRVGFTPTRLPAWLTARTTSGAGERPTFSFDWSKLLPTITLHLHGSTEAFARGPSARGSVIRWEGEGPVTHQFVHDHLRPLHAFVIQPVLDLANQAPVDAYEIPDRHRQAVHLRTPADCSPYSSTLDEGVDIDHTHPWTSTPRSAGEQAGEQPREHEQSSRLGNYGPLGRFNHRLKTFGHWTIRQPFPGIYLWRDPHGHLYLVDHTGTHKITKPGQTVGS